MHIHQYALLLRVHIITPVLLIKNSVIMHICKYALVRICINALLRIHVNASQTVQGHHPDRICILVHRTQSICIIFKNTHYNGFFTSILKTDSEHWTRSEKKSPLISGTGDWKAKGIWYKSKHLCRLFCPQKTRKRSEVEYRSVS